MEPPPAGAPAAAAAPSAAAADAGDADTAALKAAYAAELHNLKTHVQALKGRFFTRQMERAKLSEAQPALAGLGPLADWSNPAHADALRDLQQIVATELLDPAATLPIAADALHKKILAGQQAGVYRAAMAQLNQPCLSRLVAQLAQPAGGGAPLLECSMLDLNGKALLIVTRLQRAALAEYAGVPDPVAAHAPPPAKLETPPAKRQRKGSGEASLNELLEFKTSKERDKQEKGEELLELLDRKTAREQTKLQQYQTGGTAVREHCPHLTKDACRAANSSVHACSRLHHRKIIYPWTDERLGNCSYLDTCRNLRNCKRIHYELDPEPDLPSSAAPEQLGAGGLAVPKYLQALAEPQWIRCDIRNFDWSILGKFGVIMTDPPWQIHQDLPYGTMSDDELLQMGIDQLQDDGVIFMWVTGRALELGRELLGKWGYKRVDELIWVKTNSLQRLICTGRTGHWLNHSKEHCLVGYKGSPNINRYVDCDVLVSEVREMSRKPDEMYPLLERLSPGTRKLEIFARQHNVRPGWVSLGNQLDSTHITDPELLQRYTARYGPPIELEVTDRRRAALAYNAEPWAGA